MFVERTTCRSMTAPRARPTASQRTAMVVSRAMSLSVGPQPFKAHRAVRPISLPHQLASLV